ncbi:DMT family transporter [Erwinia persicina]|uniref:DMT family transporter n=1 Tax=Erwinia persicina TaxID=55211 RepID=UPI0018F80672|nr:EamA family transporter [Erwinia persicina]
MMKHVYLLGFLALMVFDTLAQVGFKYTAIAASPLTLDAAWLYRLFTQVWLYIAFAGYAGAFYTWMTLLRKVPVGPAFAASHLDIVSVTLISVWLFNDRLTLSKTLGGVLILLGILCLAKDAAARSRPTAS